MIKRISECVFSVGAVLALFWAMASWAQPASTVMGLPGSDTEAFDLGKMLWTLFVTKQYAAAFGPGLTLLVWALKKWDTKIPKIGPAIDKFLDQPMVSFALPTVISALAGGVTALATGHTLVEAGQAIFAAASSAITTYIGLMKLTEQMNAGAKAADGVTTKADAIAELKKEEKTDPAVKP